MTDVDSLPKAFYLTLMRTQRLGAHFSIAKGLSNALYTAQNYGCTALQIFTKNASTWKERQLLPQDIEAFTAARQETGIKAIAAHTAYLINLAAITQKKQARSYAALKAELMRSSALGIPFVVLHPGAHMDAGPSSGIRKIINNLNRLFAETPDVTSRLLLETTAGQGSSIGHTFEQLAEILDGIASTDRSGVCFDACHVFAAGYDLRSSEAYTQTMQAFDDIIGLDNLYFIHLNDALKPLGSKVDRHTHIGKGYIGAQGFAHIMNDPRLAHIPKIIETPKGNGHPDFDKINLDRLRGLIRT
jgi:deoxyribonuclease-4